MAAESQNAPAIGCPGCGTQIAPKLLACPACGHLVHHIELNRLADVARASTHAGDLLPAIVAWRDALELLPIQSQQHSAIIAEVDRLSRKLEESPKRPAAEPPAVPKPSRSKLGVAAGVALTFLIKFKTLAFLLLAKGKLLLLGLTKASTAFSMLATVGAYWTIWGWQFATGFVVSLYMHEMGHVAALRRYGIRAGAPMFLPGIGAFVRLKQAPINPIEDARIGLAGPWWGAAAAITCYAISVSFRSPLFAALAHTGALLNLFNLLPVWQLDGARAFRALSRPQRVILTLAIAAIGILSREHLLLLIAAVAGFRCMERDAPSQGDRTAMLHFLILIAGLTYLATMQVAH